MDESVVVPWSKSQIKKVDFQATQKVIELTADFKLSVSSRNVIWQPKNT